MVIGTFVDACLAVLREYASGECTAWASGNLNYGTMPNWDTSSVTDMSFISTFGSWNTKVMLISTATIASGTTRL